MHRLFILAAVLIPFALSCTLSPQPTQTPWVVTATFAPATQTPLGTAATIAPPTLEATTAVATEGKTPSIQSTLTPSYTPTLFTTPTPGAADIFAPNTLPPGYTGVIFKPGDCFDMDMWGMVNDIRCDFRLDENLIVTPLNGALISGHGSQTAPSLHTCQADQLLADRVAPNANIFLCVRTNSGTYGYFIQRLDTPFAAGPRMVFDYWLFK